MSNISNETKASISIIKVNQWLPEWNDNVNFDEQQYRREPKSHFYVGSISAKLLRKLSNVYRRSTEDNLPRKSDLKIQRNHDSKRSKEIANYIKYGFPWSTIHEKKRTPDYDNLKKPGWLATSIVINILGKEDERINSRVDPKDLVKIIDLPSSNISKLELPKNIQDVDYTISDLAPIEIIDGQHRLWAFDEDPTLDENFELPIVIFDSLDISWQAYLFYVINIKPEKIKASMAYDLYPLLRGEDWLENVLDHKIYKESIAQDITEKIWLHPNSPWHLKINMLEEKGLKYSAVSQAAWVRSLVATILKSNQKSRNSFGGLFGSKLGSNQYVLSWTRFQQAAFLIYFYNKLHECIFTFNPEWLTLIKSNDIKSIQSQLNLPNTEQYDQDNTNIVFHSKASLLSTDQGVRSSLEILNIFFVSISFTHALTWESNVPNTVEQELEIISLEMEDLRKTCIGKILNQLANVLAKFDWRSSSSTDSNEESFRTKQALRGSGGYKILRELLLEHIAINEHSIELAKIAKSVLQVVKDNGK